MSDLFAIGYSGVKAYQSALNTTSENIANAATPGYSKRSATIAEVGRANSIGLGQTTHLTGQGARITGIARSADDFRNDEVRTAGADLARTETGVVWLDRVEGALTGNQLSERLTAFFNAGAGVAADPAATAPRAVMLETATSLASAFSGTGAAIDRAMEDLKGSGADAATRLTDLAASLVRVNASLTRVTPGSVQQAQALDERDRLLEGMSALVDVDIDTDAFGRATVRAGGGGGPVVADAAGSAFIAFSANASGAVSFVAMRGDAADVVPAHGGVLAGIADGAARLAGARDVVNDIAARFVTGINTLQAGGRTLDGTTGPPLFATGATPTDISVVLTTPRGIAAAAAGEGVRGNGTMTALATLRTSGGFEAGIADQVTANAAALAARRDVASAQGAIRDGAVASQQGVCGVDIDEEAVNLIRFQQAYQASSRVIQVARDILQTIIDIR